MANAPIRAPLLGPAFIRLLARLAETGTPRSPPVLSEQLSQWFDWNRAITLSKALDDRVPAAVETSPFDAAQEAECARMRAVLGESITAAVKLAPAGPATADTGEDLAQVDYAPFRQHCLGVQRAMQAATGQLRGRLREMLAQQSPAKARLAEVDAVMELTLSPREQKLLASVPGLLEKHFLRLREAAPPATTAWLDGFQRDMQGVLLAELDVRFHPIEGLLAALRTR
ncbi:MAG: DUF3348 domain-containing protein [Stenotrophomonas sp.]